MCGESVFKSSQRSSIKSTKEWHNWNYNNESCYLLTLLYAKYFIYTIPFYILLTKLQKFIITGELIWCSAVGSNLPVSHSTRRDLNWGQRNASSQGGQLRIWYNRWGVRCKGTWITVVTTSPEKRRCKVYKI